MTATVDCPQCGGVLNARATLDGRGHTPRPGNVMICHHCSAVNVFTTDGLVAPEVKVLDGLLASPGVQQVLAQINSRRKKP